jgi:hypothetical protein
MPAAVKKLARRIWYDCRGSILLSLTLTLPAGSFLAFNGVDWSIILKMMLVLSVSSWAILYWLIGIK